MIKACLLLLAGGFAAQHSRVPISSDLCKFVLVASVALLAYPRTRSVGCLALGFVLFMQAGLGIIAGQLDERFAGDSLLTRVRIVDFPQDAGESTVMHVTPLNDPRLPPFSRVSWFEPPVTPAIGDTWELELRLKIPRGNSNPGVFDYEAWLFRQGIHATGYVVNGKRNRLLQADAGSLVDKKRARFVDRARVVSGSREIAAVLAAVGVGTRHLVSAEQWDRYALSGTSHLMAISGLHVGLAATATFLLLLIVFGTSRLSANPQVAAVTGGVVAALGYAGLSGFGVPAQRASLMLIVFAAALIRRRQPDPAATLAFAAVIVFLLDPVATMTPGFSLSFSAVAVLLWLARRRNAWAAATGRAARIVTSLRQLVVMQLFLLLGLMPLTVLIFQRIALLSMPANIMAVPLFSMVTVPFALAGFALGGIAGGIGDTALRVAAFSIEWLERGIQWIVELPFADITIAGIGGRMWLVVFMPALWVLLPRGWPGRRLAWLAVMALLVYVPEPPRADCFDAHVLDVGQGLAVVVQTERNLLVFDTGISYRGGGSAAEQVVVPFLQSRGLSSIHQLLVSHADIDHSGGIAALHEYADIHTTYAGEPLHLLPSARRCHTGQHWEVDGVSFRLIHPEPSTANVGNDSSCVLAVEAGGHGVLLTGDIEADAERAISQSGRLHQVTVVVVPHHGSTTSSSPAFVDATSPRLAIVSAGYGNRWGFPKPAVVERWRSVGAEVVTTAAAGAVSLRFCAQGGLYEVRKDRHERRRFWRRGED